MQRICTANIKNDPGKCVYTQMLNNDGGIEADVTIVCLERNYFRIISSAATRERDKFHINKNLTTNIELTDVTDKYCVFGLFGPKSRELISSISKEDFSNKNFKFATGKKIKINNVETWVQRLS